MIRHVLLSVLMSTFAAQARAGDLSVRVTTQDGKPLENAVVSIPSAPGTPKPSFPWKLEMAQIDKTFQPFVLIAPVGATVTFPNLDKFRHHVYSFSKGNRFELELFGRDEKRSHVFEKVGVAALGCNIHDEMVAFVRIVDTPHVGKTDATGLVVVKGAPNGAAKVTVWHPNAKSRDQTTFVDATLSDGAVSELTVAVEVSGSTGH